MIQFNEPFENLRLAVPPSSIIGVIAEGTCNLAEAAQPAEPDDCVLHHTLARCGAVEKAQEVARIVGLRAAGSSILLISHDEPLLETCADEIWWLRDDQLIAKGDPAEVLAKYRAHVATTLRAAGEGQRATVLPAMRKGDGRASIEGIELLGQTGEPSAVWRSGEPVIIALQVRFAAAVEQPVVGIMIRTRIGLNVYGTNTELEGLALGPVAAGDARRVNFSFQCDLCPGQYTVTAASHDPDGLWHDWLEDAVAFSVTDARYTAGVANLRAKVAVVPHLAP